MDGVPWEKHFQYPVPVHSNFTSTTVLPLTSDRMTLEMWGKYFPPPFPVCEAPNISEEEYLEIQNLKTLRLRALPEIEFEPEWDEATYEYIASYVLCPNLTTECQGVVSATSPTISPKVDQIKQKLLDKYAKTVFAPQLPRVIPDRGPHCFATIHLVDGAIPKNKKVFSDDLRA